MKNPFLKKVSVLRLGEVHLPECSEKGGPAPTKRLLVSKLNKRIAVTAGNRREVPLAGRLRDIFVGLCKGGFFSRGAICEPGRAGEGWL